jgi:hypothetical protein
MGMRSSLNVRDNSSIRTRADCEENFTPVKTIQHVEFAAPFTRVAEIEKNGSAH